ncbi:MAG TPA: hypothetical protein V6C81_08430 [Planktothrix sp.]
MKRQIAALGFGICMLAAPAFAQNQLTNGEPIVGSLHTREANLQTCMNMAFESGQIDSTQLAQYQRDLDGVLAKENDFKGRNDGLTTGGCKNLNKRLDVLEASLGRQANLRTASDQVVIFR